MSLEVMQPPLPHCLLLSVPQPTILALGEGLISEGYLLATISEENTFCERPGSWSSLQGPYVLPESSATSLLHPHGFFPTLSVPVLLTPYLCLNSPGSFCLRAFALADHADAFPAFPSQLTCHPSGRWNKQGKNNLHFSSLFFGNLDPPA